MNWSQRSIAAQADRDGEVTEAICHEMVLFPVVPPSERIIILTIFKYTNVLYGFSNYSVVLSSFCRP